MELISHDDRTLGEHLTGLKDVVDKILPEKTQVFFEKKELTDLIYNLISYHDVAKASPYFQVYLANALVYKNRDHKYHSIEELQSFLQINHSHFKRWQSNPELKRHALLGAWLSFFIWNEEIEYNLDTFLLFKVLQSHHGYLKNFILPAINPKNQKDNLIQITSEIDFDSYSNLL